MKDTIKYRSKLEEAIALFLKSKKIVYQYEKYRYQLIPPFQYAGKMIRGLTYTPDFTFNLYDKEIIVEVKGYRREDYIIKSKLFMLTNIIPSDSKVFCEIGSIQDMENILREIEKEHRLEEDASNKQNPNYKLTMKCLLLQKGGKKQLCNHTVFPNLKRKVYGAKGHI